MEVIGNSFDVEADIVHLAELPIGTPVVGPSLGGLLHPLVMVFALTMAVFRRLLYPKLEQHTMALV